MFLNLHIKIKITTLILLIENEFLPTFFFLILIKILYFIGIFNIITNMRNFLITMLWIEVMYVSIFLDLISLSIILNLPMAQIYALVLLIAIAGESCIGLGLLLNLQKKNKTLTINK